MQTCRTVREVSFLLSAAYLLCIFVFFRGQSFTVLDTCATVANYILFLYFFSTARLPGTLSVGNIRLYSLLV